MLEPATNREPARFDLDRLARLDAGALTRLYRQARAPRSLADLGGADRGRVLALAPPFDRVRSVLSSFASSPLFPWRGKSFHTTDGANRFALIGERFAFRMRLDRSALDSERCAVLDYDVPANPAPLRRVVDELREISPGLFFGPALLRTGTEPKLILFFAVERAV